MDDNLPNIIDLKHSLTGVLSELPILIIARLLRGGRPDEVQLLGEVHTARDAGPDLAVGVECLDPSLVDLVLDRAEVVLERADRAAALRKLVLGVLSFPHSTAPH